MLKRRLKLKTESPNIAWFPFYPQEHKTHNNVSLVMEHIFQLCTVKGEEAIEIHGVGFTIDWNKTPMIVMKIMIPLL